jgi:hypothetical protein
MIQCRHGPGFALEPFTELCLGHLDGDRTIQAAVTGFVDIAHSARTDCRKDFVRAESVAGRKGHLVAGAKSSRSGKSDRSAGRSEPRELKLQRIDLCQVAAGVVVAASLAASEPEPVARVGVAGPAPTQVDDRREVLPLPQRRAGSFTNEPLTGENTSAGLRATCTIQFTAAQSASTTTVARTIRTANGATRRASSARPARRQTAVERRARPLRVRVPWSAPREIVAWGMMRIAPVCLDRQFPATCSRLSDAP